MNDHDGPFVADADRREPGGTDRVEHVRVEGRGHRSGKARRTALVYVRDGDRYVIAASNAGAGRHPLWYLNLVAEPGVVVQIGAETFRATARTATAPERPRLWGLMVAAMPSYAEYQKATSREIPVVLLTR